MYPYYQTLGYKTAEARQTELLDTIQNCRYLASHKLALDDARQRALAEVTRSRLLADAGVASGWRPSAGAMRQRLGAALIGVGTRLQGASPAAAAVTLAPSGSGVPTR